MAVALLLKLSESNEELASQLTIESYLQMIETCEKLHFDHIQARIQQSLGKLLEKYPSQCQNLNEVNFAKATTLFRDYSMKHNNLGQDIELYNEFVSTIPKIGNADTCSISASGDEKSCEEKEIEGLRLAEDNNSQVCSIDTVNIEALTVTAFYEQYVKLNKPLIIKLSRSEEQKQQQFLEGNSILKKFLFLFATLL